MTTAGFESLKRFLLYDARLVQRDDRAIQTAVIYSGRIIEAPDFLSCGSLTYSVSNVYMKDYDGDEEYRKLHTKISQGHALTEEEILIGAIVAVTDHILPEEYKRRLLEVLKMTQIEQWLKEEGRAEGIKKGIQEGMEQGLERGLEKGLEKGLERGLEKGLLNGKIKATQEAIVLVLYLTTRYGEAPTPLLDMVPRLQDLGVLEQLLKALYATANFSQAQAAIERFSSHKPAIPQ